MFPNSLFKLDQQGDLFNPGNSGTSGYLSFQTRLTPDGSNSGFNELYTAYYGFVYHIIQSDQLIGLTIFGNDKGDGVNDYTIFDNQALPAGHQLIRLPAFAPWTRARYRNTGAGVATTTVARVFSFS